jgi:class 3 adenylate cyclase/alpha-beta hydrolase superfamily lysophospholipase
MTEPKIQYARTSDGVNIAYWKTGAGKPLVYMPPLLSGMSKVAWEIPEFRRWYEELGKRCTLIAFDNRGSGLSERKVSELSMDSLVCDLSAVVDAAAAGEFRIFAAMDSAAVAVSYAVKNPERVSEIILLTPLPRPSRFMETPQARALLTLIDEDWDFFTETIVRYILGWSEGIKADRMAALYRESMTPEVQRALLQAELEMDVTDLLPRVSAPTLILHRRGVPNVTLDAITGVAAAIPNARLVLLEGELLPAYLGDIDATLAAIDEFISGESSSQPSVSAPAGGSLRTILFTDLVGHTEMMSRLGDSAGREVLREHERITREVLAAHGGTEVKTMGDGFMASFGSVTKAVECAIGLQRAFTKHEGEPLSVRVGLNAGEPIEEEGDLFGATVILASRIAAIAEGGEILVSDNVRSLSAGKGFLFSDRGEFVAKGFEDPVRLCEVSWREDAR